MEKENWPRNVTFDNVQQAVGLQAVSYRLESTVFPACAKEVAEVISLNSHLQNCHIQNAIFSSD